MARRPQVQTGTTGGCLFNGCIVLCVLLLVTVVSAWIWLTTQPERDEAKARANLRANVERNQQRLSRVAADGILQDAEIAQLFPPAKPAKGLVDIKRQAESTTVIAEMLGLGASDLVSPWTRRPFIRSGSARRPRYPCAHAISNGLPPTGMSTGGRAIYFDRQTARGGFNYRTRHSHCKDVCRLYSSFRRILVHALCRGAG